MPLASKASQDPPALGLVTDEDFPVSVKPAHMSVTLRFSGWGVLLIFWIRKCSFLGSQNAVSTTDTSSVLGKRRYFPCSVWVFSIPGFFLVLKFRSWMVLLPVVQPCRVYLLHLVTSCCNNVLFIRHMGMHCFEDLKPSCCGQKFECLLLSNRG